MEKTKLGISENIAAAIAYSLPPIAGITGLIMLFLEPDNKYVRFHAMQSFITAIALGIFTTLISLTPFLGRALAGFMGIAVICLWVVLVTMALTGKYYKLPVIGQVVYEKIVK